jgi:hypothetical protein
MNNSKLWYKVVMQNGRNSHEDELLWYELNRIASNKIEWGIGNIDDQILGYASINEAKVKVHRRLHFNN